VDFEEGTITVSTQIVQVGWETEEGEPKTDSGARTVLLDADTIEVLRAHQAAQIAERAEWGDLWTDTGKVFTREDGTALHPETAPMRFERLAFRAGLPPIRLHDLRHVAATLLLAATHDLKLVQELLGHTTITLAGNTYTTVLPEVARAAAEGVAHLIRTARPEPIDPQPIPDATAPNGHTLAPHELPRPRNDQGQQRKPRSEGEPRVGVEPTTCRLQGGCSDRLS
jgi:hypothetical protein